MATTITTSDNGQCSGSSSQPAAGSSNPLSPRRQTRFPLYTPEHVLPRSKWSQSEDVSHKRWKKPSTPRCSVEKFIRPTERTPLLHGGEGPNDVPEHRSPSSSTPRHKKPFYRARPLWLVPFAVVASLVRGMTLAPRVEVYTQLSCYSLHGRHEYNHTIVPQIHLDSIEWERSPAISLYSSLDPLGPYLFTHPLISNTSYRQPIHRPIEPPLSSSHRHKNSSNMDDNNEGESDQDPRRIPSARCLSDPAVQANAARLQTILTTTMGLLSALTTGWWGHFGERYGRTRVLAVATFGLFWADLVFILTSTPNLPFPLSWFSYTSKFNHAHRLLLLAPLVEGLLGGWSTLQSATSAYISDCTSPGSRAQIFSRFTGVFYLGFSAGPAIAAWLIHHSNLLPLSSSSSPGKLAQRQTVTSVFWIAVTCSLINFFLALFVFPESLSKEKRERAKQAYESRRVVAGTTTSSSGGKGKEKALDFPVMGVEDVEGVGIGAIVDVDELTSPVAKSSSATPSRFVKGQDSNGNGQNVSLVEGLATESIIMRFLRPLVVFLPVYVDMPTRNALTVKRRKDYSLTLLAAGLFAWLLSTGVYQIKYLYASHTYRWEAEQLSYYISFMGGARATFLLVFLPFLISTFKSKSKPESHVAAAGPSNGKGKARADQHREIDHDIEANDAKDKKPAPTRLELGKAIRFDLRLTRCSLLIDIIGNLLIAISPSPTLSAHATLADTTSKGQRGHPGWSITQSQSQTVFVLASALNSFASGMVPAVHSLALCIIQARTIEADFRIEGYSSDGRQPSVATTAAPVDTGSLFGAFAVLQAVGQMILGPMLFGIVYSESVASHPKMIFIVASGLLVFSLVLIMIVKNPVGEVRLARRDKKFRKRMEDGHGAFGVSSSGPGGSSFRYTGGGTRKGKGKNWEQEIERRGRSRLSKDLRGGAIGWSLHPGERSGNGSGEQDHMTRSA